MVGGCGAGAVSRKTPIYFMIYLITLLLLVISLLSQFVINSHLPAGARNTFTSKPREASSFLAHCFVIFLCSWDWDDLLAGQLTRSFPSEKLRYKCSTPTSQVLSSSIFPSLSVRNGKLTILYSETRKYRSTNNYIPNLHFFFNI